MVRKLRNPAKCRDLLRTKLDADNRRCYYENCREWVTSVPELKEHLKQHFAGLLEDRVQKQRFVEKLERLRRNREQAADQAEPSDDVPEAAQS